MPTEKDQDKFNLRQELFCKKLIELNWHATNAAIAAGYSKKTAYSMANKLRKLPKIKRRIAEIIAEDLDMEKEQIRLMIVHKLKSIMTANVLDDLSIVTKTFQEPVMKKGKQVGVKNVTHQVLEIKDTKDFKNPDAIASIRRGKTGFIEIKYHNPIPAAELLGRWGVMFTDKIEIDNDMPEVNIYLPENGRNDK